MGGGIHDMGAIAFAEALAINSNLTKLTLSSNLISDIGAEAFIKTLQKNVGDVVYQRISVQSTEQEIGINDWVYAEYVITKGIYAKVHRKIGENSEIKIGQVEENKNGSYLM